MTDEDVWTTADAFIRDLGDLACNEALNAAEAKATLKTMEGVNWQIAPEPKKQKTVILAEVDHARWLGREASANEELKATLKQSPGDRTQLWPVGKQVGSANVDEAAVIKPAMGR